MEHYILFAGVPVLLTTGADRSECQYLSAYDTCEIVISIDDCGATILKGARHE